jgi:hypothetical protein
MPAGRIVRCRRCKSRTENSLNLEGWAVNIKDGEIAGYICPTCLKPNEATDLPEGASLDVGHGYEDVDLSIKGNFRFLKKRMTPPDYYGKREAMVDWETVSDMLRRAMEQAGESNKLAIEIEIQTLWNFKIEMSKQDSQGRVITCTGYHTQGMKKGKQIDPELIANLLAMGMKQPEGDVRDWSIQLQPQECVPSHVNRVIIHILDRGYEFNPNLMQQIIFDAD